jgi:hypothetical protein
MIKRSTILWVSLAIFLVAGPAGYYLWAKVHNEHFYCGRPTSYWRQEVRRYCDGSWSRPFLDGCLDFVFGRSSGRPAVFARSPSTVPVLADLVRDADSHVSLSATRFLAGWADSVSALEDVGHGDNRIEALESVGPETVAAVAKGLDNPNVLVRRETALLLGYLGPHARDAVPALVQALQDKDEGVRETAEKTLKRIGKRSPD